MPQQVQQQKTDTHTHTYKKRQTIRETQSAVTTLAVLQLTLALTAVFTSQLAPHSQAGAALFQKLHLCVT